MKSKAHYKKCCELGINPNEENDAEGGEMAQCSGETDDDTESEGDEGNEGETESSGENNYNEIIYQVNTFKKSNRLLHNSLFQSYNNVN